MDVKMTDHEKVNGCVFEEVMAELTQLAGQEAIFQRFSCTHHKENPSP